MECYDGLSLLRYLYWLSIWIFSPNKIMPGTGVVDGYLEQNIPTVLLEFNWRPELFSHVVMPPSALVSFIAACCFERPCEYITVSSA